MWVLGQKQCFFKLGHLTIPCTHPVSQIYFLISSLLPIPCLLIWILLSDHSGHSCGSGSRTFWPDRIRPFWHKNIICKCGPFRLWLLTCFLRNFFNGLEVLLQSFMYAWNLSNLTITYLALCLGRIRIRNEVDRKFRIKIRTKPTIPYPQHWFRNPIVPAQKVPLFHVTSTGFTILLNMA